MHYSRYVAQNCHTILTDNGSLVSTVFFIVTLLWLVDLNLTLKDFLWFSSLFHIKTVFHWINYTLHFSLGMESSKKELFTHFGEDRKCM